MPVQIIINGENAAESLSELSALAAGLVSESKPVEPAKVTARQSKTTKPATKTEPKKETPAEDTAEEKMDDEPVAENSEDIPSDEALRAAALKKSKVVGKAKVKELLDSYEVANVTALPDDQRIAFLEELEGLEK